MAAASFALGVVVFVVDLASPALRVAPLEIVPIVSIALLVGERVALYAAVALTALGMLFGHLAGRRPINGVAVANAVILALSYAAALVIVRQARTIAERMTTLAQEAADAKRVHDALFSNPIAADGTWEIEVMHLPLSGVGGDFFGVRRDAGRTVAFVADVSGKGIQGAMLLTALKTVFDATSAAGLRPRQALAAFNRALQGLVRSEMFATAWLAVLDDDGSVRYASAGHEPALRGTAGGTLQTLPGGGLPLGIQSEADVAESAVRLAPGEMLLAYSDGVTNLLDAGLVRPGELFSDFDDVKRRLPALERRDDVLALRMTYRGRVEAIAPER